KRVLSSAMGNPQMNSYLAGTDFDVQAMHPYPGTGPMADFYKYDNFDVPTAALTGGSKPIWNTETGYYTGTDTGNVTEAAEGKYIPRMLTEFFNKGVQRTYLYELVDEASDASNRENRYGLARQDGSAKPAFNAVKNLIALTDETPTWDATAKSFHQPVNAAGSLDYTIAHDPSETTVSDISNIHHLLLKKSNGEYDLLLWREASKNDTSAATRKVAITINSPLTSASYFSDLTQSTLTPTTTWSNRSTFSIDVPDSVVVLRLTPGTSVAPQSLGVTDNFEGQAAGQAPSGWTSASGDTSFGIASIGGNEFAQSTAASGDHYLSKTINLSGASAFTSDFDYTWQTGGTASYGDYAQTVGMDVMDVSGNGYRIKFHEGNSGVSTNTAKTVEIYKLNAGAPDAAPMATGTGFNQAGWDTLGYAAPNFHHVRVAYDSGVFTVYGDTNFNGTMDILATAKDTTYTNFTRLKLRTLDSTNTGPSFDDVQTNVPTVSIAALDASAAESPADTGKFRITRTGGDLTTALSVSYVVLGSATNGTDYATIPLSATIPANASYVDVAITPPATADSAVEGDENVVLKLSELPGYHVDDNLRSADVTIKDYAPDLTITEIKMSNTTPKDGDIITYQVTIKNNGNAPSPTNLGYRAALLFDTQGATSYVTSPINASIPAGQTLTLNVTGSYTFVAHAGKHMITAWVDYGTNFGSSNGVVPETNDRNNAFVMTYNVASSRFTDGFTSLSNWTTTGDGWTVKTTGTQTYAENSTTGTGTRSIKHTLSPTADHSWTVDFGHNWQWGGAQHSLSISADVLDNTNSGFRVRFYQGDSGNAANDSSLVKIFKVTNGVEAGTPLAQGAGFNQSGWRTLNLSAPTWRRSRIAYDVGTRTIKVLVDLAGNGAYTTVASAADLNAPTTFTSLGFNAEGLQNTVAPELDDVQMDLLY
ncbi:MAG: hypothetical protein JWM57_1954, partial [Phycisphaerales bacterium]|nr:hypothetical protein [Phycisphaerales bacterium]